MRALTSFTTRSAIMRSRSDSSTVARKSADLAMDRSHTSWMLRPPTVTPNDSGLSRAPPQSEQGTSRM